MEFKNLKPGFSDDLVSFKVVSKSQIHEKLLRLTVADSSNEHGNVIIQSDPLIKKFECILPETNIAMSQFLITDAYADISQYFPDFIHGYDIATFNTNYD